MAPFKNPLPTVACIELPVDDLPEEPCFDPGPLLADSLRSQRTGQRRKP